MVNGAAGRLVNRWFPGRDIFKGTAGGGRAPQTAPVAPELDMGGEECGEACEWDGGRS